MDFDKLDSILQNGSIQDLEEFCSQNNLVIDNGKIRHQNPKEVESAVEHWDKRQLVKKINLNS